MKTFRILSILLAVFCGVCTLSAQESQYEKAMQAALEQWDKDLNAKEYKDLSDQFEQIAKGQPSAWEPFYYAAFCRALSAMKDKNNADTLSAEAKRFVHRAIEIGGDTSELNCLMAHIHTAKLMVDPHNRWQTEGMMISKYIDDAIKANSNNPRPYLFRTESLLHTPSTIGGGKVPARKMLAIAIQKFSAFRKSTPFAPDWGQKRATKLLRVLDNQD